MAMGLNQDGKPMLTTAQHAGPQGRLTGQHLMWLTQRKALEDYGPNTLGAFISLGGLLSVGWMKVPWNQKLAMTGGLAHVMKRASGWR